MKRKAMLLALAPLLALACGQAADHGDYELAMLMLPEGQPEAGREAFVALGCATCHAVAWDGELPAPVSPTPGPELGVDPVQLGPGGVAASITAPAHKVPARYRKDDGATPMPEYSQIMTIRQLADIVTYLRRQGLETQARTGSGS